VFVAFFIGYGAGRTITSSDRYSVIKVQNDVVIVGALLLSSSQHALIYELDGKTSNATTTACLSLINVKEAIDNQKSNIVRVVPWDTILDIRLCQS
jgi:hypothetical protein